MAEDIKKTGEKVPEDFLVNEEEIRIMPKKFVVLNPKKKDSGAKGIIVFFVLIFVLLMALLGGGYYWLQQKNKPKDTNTNVNQNTNQNTNIGNENTNANVNTNENTNFNANTNNSNNNQNNNTNTSTNINTNTNENPNPPVATVDTDSDGLTDLEEQTYQTDKQIMDSDKDGYSDGDEIKNLYNPLASGQKLIDSGLVIRYANDLYAYEIFSPKAWLIKAIDDSRQKIEFIPDTSTSELVRIEVAENVGKKSLVDWQKTLYGTQAMENFKIDNQAAVRSTDKKQVLIVTSDYVYTIIYDISNDNANFATTFEMMLKSFKFVSPKL
jgi:hypothetical protein